MDKWLTRLAEKTPDPPAPAPCESRTEGFAGFVGTQGPRFQDIEALIHWRELTAEQMKALGQRVKQGSVRIHSDTLNEAVWWVRDEYTAAALRSQGVTEVIYTLAELKELAGKPAEFLCDLHRVKTVFGATLMKADDAETQRPAPQS